MDAGRQQEIDRAMITLDGTDNKSRLGSNTILSVSIAVAKAAAASTTTPLFLYLRQFINTANLPPKIPTPVFTTISGGKYGTESINFQEFLIIPASSKSFEESLQIGFHLFASLQNILKLNGLSTMTTSDGGFNPKVATNYDALSLLMQSADNTAYRLGYDIFFGIDAG